ncbi:MAG TPA: Gfo/Idh/MocA family oxidoreductase [Anaerolineaceae bacterium]
MKTLQWGLLSTARINHAVIGPLQRSQRNALLGVASRDRARAEAYAAQESIPRAYGSYEEMLADPEIDVVYVSLPNGLHAEWAVRAAQAGKHVLCEKPLAVTLEQVDAIIAAAHENHVVIAEAFMYRHHPQTLKVQELAQSGQLGKILFVRGSFGFQLSREVDVRLETDLDGGSLWDVGCYPVSFARTVLREEPCEVFGQKTAGPSGVDIFFTGMMRFPGGATAQFDSGFRPSYRTTFEVVGDERSVLVNMPFKPGDSDGILLKHGKGEEFLPNPPFDLYSGEVEDMAAAVLDGRPQRISLEDSRANVAALLALHESARSGKPVQLPAR